MHCQSFLNKINDEIEKPIATILAQTSRSAEEFRDYIDLRHRPLASRLQDPVDMSYDLDETKKITKIKLQAEAIDVFAEKRKGNELFPLDDETLEYLFEHVNALTQTANKMTAYRDVEQILHDAIEESLEQNKEKVELSIVQEIFEKRKSKIGNPSENKRKLSLETRNAIDSAMKNEDQNDANCDYLNGIKVGMAEFEPREYSKVESAMASSWKTDSSTGIFISSINWRICFCWFMG